MTAGEIRIARSDEERMRVFRFRHQVYVDEMRMPLDTIDAALGIVRDAVDDNAALYFREGPDGQIIATVRQLIGTPAQVDAMHAVFETQRFRRFCADHELSFSARLAIRSDWRCSTVLRELAERLYQNLFEAGIRFDFMVCTPGLLSMYEAIGYRRYKAAVCFSDLGYRIPLVLDVDDGEYLRRIRSPLSRLAANAPARSPPLRLADIVPDTAPCIGPADDPRTAHAAHLAEAFTHDPGNPFRLLDERLLWSLLTRFKLLKTAIGEPIIVAGTAGDELFLIIRGRADRIAGRGSEARIVESYADGQCFGISGFLSGGCRTDGIVIGVDGTELLVIDRPGFDALTTIVPQLGIALLPRLIAAQDKTTLTFDSVASSEVAKPLTHFVRWQDEQALAQLGTAS